MANAVEVRVPNIGDFKDVPVIEVLVKSGDVVKVNDPLITIESEKASLEVPAPSAGKVENVAVKVGDKVSEGTPILTLAGDGVLASGQPVEQPAAPTTDGKATTPRPEPATTPADGETKAPEQQPAPQPSPQSQTAASAATPQQAPAAAQPAAPEAARVDGAVHASPSIRRFARELGVDLSGVKGTGPHARITREDVQGYVKRALAEPRAPGGALPFNIPPWPKIDFAQFGPIETVALSRIKKISGPILARNWVMIPHVTNHEEADITDLEQFRQQLNKEYPNVKVTMLAFLIKAVVAALQRYPELNASLDGDNLVLKKYYNIGFAADTPNGLLVPVVKNADQKGLLVVAQETRDLAAKAREGKLSLAEMQGASFTISSLGGIGGTGFTPIINAPEVAILGASRASMRPCWNGKEFEPRLILPLSLSYDHRVVDGAQAAHFNDFLAGVLGDMRRAML